MVDLLGFNINKALSWKSSDKAEPDGLIFDHISPYHTQTFLPLIADNLTVIPLRHPILTAKSWSDRKKEIGDLVESWEILVNEIDPLEPYYLPLDIPDRQDYLDRLNAGTGRSMVTDWGAKGVVHNNQAMRYTDIQPSAEIAALCERIKPFLDRFYE